MIFTVMGCMVVTCDVEIKADSWEEVVEEAKKLKVPDFCQPKGGGVFMDFEGLEITGIYK